MKHQYKFVTGSLTPRGVSAESSQFLFTSLMKKILPAAAAARLARHHESCSFLFIILISSNTAALDSS